MSGALDHAHDGVARSWLASANAAGGDFPSQNLPFAVFRRGGEDSRGVVAIGEQVVDVAALARNGAVCAGLASSALARPARSRR